MSNKPINNNNDSKCETAYHVLVKTGDEKGAGTDVLVKLVIVGDKDRTKAHRLEYHERNSKYQINLKDSDIGDFEYAILDVGVNAKGKFHAWYVEYVQITKDGNPVIQLSVHKWITASGQEILMTNKTCIPQRESAVRAAARVPAIKSLEWCHNLPGMCGYVAAPPTHWYAELNTNLKFSTSKGKQFKGYILQGIFDFKIEQFKSAFTTRFSCLDDYLKPTRFDHKHEQPKWLKNWKTDEEFGRQILNGPNPGEIRRCYKLPANFPITEKHTNGLLKRGITLKEEMMAGNIYIINHHLLEGISTGVYKKKKVQLAVPICLFYVRPDECLVPIAIQLGQQPTSMFPIWTPHDAPLDWLLVKMWFKNADTQMHEMNTHLGLTHFAQEPFAVAMHRCLSPAHPIYKLLREHIEHVCAINTFGRERLLAPGGSIDSSISIGQGSNGILESLQSSHRNLQMNAMNANIPKNIKDRDVADIPHYHYRDDALLIWNALMEFVKSIIDIYYQNDADVCQDHELQNFMHDLYHEGFNFDGNIDHCGITESISNKQALIELMTTVISIGTIAHTSVNFLQYEYYHIIPNCPAIMRGDIPTEAERGTIDEKMIMDTLPDVFLSNWMCRVAWQLSQIYEDEIHITDYPRWLFCDEESNNALVNFKANLLKAEETISKRNLKLEIPYEVLLPSRLPSGISI